MKEGGFLLILTILVSSISFATITIIESGDNGEEFAKQSAKAMCQENNVQAVYTCLGNVIRVVSDLPGEGSTFYKPDGKVVHCPVVSPSEMGAECIQMMTPNYCPVQAECGESTAPLVFPAQNDTPEQTGDGDYYIVDETVASDDEEKIEEEEIPTPIKKEKPISSVIETENFDDIPPTSPGIIDSALDNLVFFLLILGIGSVGLLFLMFKKSLQE